MKIKSVRIRTYRTVRDEANIDLSGGPTLVGPNNAGKTNILKGIRLFFTGYDNAYKYDRSTDLSIGQGASQTSVSVTFSRENTQRDDSIYLQFDALKDALEIGSDGQDDVTVYLTLSPTSRPVYRVFPNTKRPTKGSANAQYSKLERSFVDSILDSFSVHYIPSDKSTSQLYESLVLPFIFKKAFLAISPALGEIKSAMGVTADTLTGALHSAGLSSMSCSFSFPSTPDKFFREASFNISDPDETSISEKGMGIQSAALLASFIWISNEEATMGKNVLWLLEEPESYLHPELAEQCRTLILKLRDVSQVVTTTHALGFVPQDPKSIIGVERVDGWTKPTAFKTYTEATARIRKSLGVKFSDFYNLNIYNLIVEGETDREYIQALISKISLDVEARKRFPILTSGQLSCLDQGGVKGVEGFVKVTYEFIRQERPAIIILDGDKAGDDCRRAMQNYLGNKGIHLVANQHYVSVRDRFAVEGLFPDSWVIAVHQSNPGWFADFSTDAEGTLQPFGLKDDHKRQFFNAMIVRMEAEANLDWAERWMGVLSIVESALAKEAARIYGSASPATLLDEEASSHALADGTPIEVTALWRDRVLKALETLGGEGTLEQIYAEVEAKSEKLAPTWQATVRRTLGDHCKSSTHFNGAELFSNPAKGVWRTTE
ncbi:MAG: AAA family ATPase [Pseudomonadota bacterium]